MQKLLVSLLVLSSFAVLLGQTATTGSISGTVTDPSGAAVPSASVEVTNVATGLIMRQSVQENGQYVFPNVAPGEYTLKATAQGFRAGVISAIRVEVTKSYAYDVKLEVGQVTETVEVRSEARAELQMIDATIGTVIPGKALPTMPLFTRQVNELLTAQPGTNPATGEVTGSRNDQSTSRSTESTSPITTRAVRARSSTSVWKGSKNSARRWLSRMRLSGAAQAARSR